MAGSNRFRNLLAARMPLLGLFLLLSPFITAVLTVLVNGVPDAPTAGDTALLEISTRNTATGETLIGPYSRLGFHHPGPAYFFLRIPFYYLSGFAASSSCLTVALLGMLSLIGIYGAAKRHGSALLATLFCLIAALYLRAMGPVVWMSDWNAFVITLPMLFFVVSLSALSAGDHRWLLPTVLAGSFAAQTHLGCAPTVAILFTASLLMIASGNARLDSKGIRWSIWLSAAAAVALWLPVLYQQFSSTHGGNLSALLAFFRNSSPEPLGLTTVREWAASMVTFEFPPMAGSLLRRAGFLSEFYALITFLRVLALAICYLLARRNLEDGFFRALCLLSFLAHAITLFSALQIREGLYQHILTWFSFVAPLSWMAIAGTMVRVIRLDRIKGIALAPIVILTAAASITSVRSGTEVLTRMDVDPRIDGLSEMISDHIAVEDTSASWYIALGDRELWPVMAGVVNDLQKQGLRFEVDPAYGSMTGLAPDGGASPILLTSDSLWNPECVLLGKENGTAIGFPALPR